MTENIFTPRTVPQTDPPGDPTLRRKLELPKGVLQKNLEFSFISVRHCPIVAALFSSSGKKTTAQQAGSEGQPPQPTLQDNTDSNVQELKNQIQAERWKERRQWPLQRWDIRRLRPRRPRRERRRGLRPHGVAAPCVPGQPCSQLQQGDTQVQPTPIQQQAQLIAAKRAGTRGQLTFRFQPCFFRLRRTAATTAGQVTSTQYGPADRQPNSNPAAPESERKQRRHTWRQ